MKNIVFDFDGTIVDTYDCFAHFIAEEASHLPLSEEQLKTLRGLSLLATARQLGHGWWRLPGLYFAGKRWMEHFIDDLEPFDGMTGIIDMLSVQGRRLFIVSSNSVHNIETFLTQEGIDHDFIKIYGNVAIRSKGHVLKKLIKHNRLARQDTCYVGDEPRDIRAAKRAGLKSVAVTWGYSKAETLKPHRPDYLLEQPAQLMELFARI